MHSYRPSLSQSMGRELTSSSLPEPYGAIGVLDARAVLRKSHIVHGVTLSTYANDISASTSALEGFSSDHSNWDLYVSVLTP